MRLVIVVVLALSTTATADPEELATAKAAWNAAEREPDAARAAALWEVAARAFDKAAAGKHAKPAYEAVRAWQNAVNLSPVPARKTLSARDQGLLDAIAVYLPLASAAERPTMLYLRARTFFKRDLFDQAIPILETIVMAHPGHDVGAYAASFLLDALNLKGDFEAMGVWVAKLRAMPALVAGRPELADTLDRIHVQVLRRKATKAQADGDFRTCAALFQEAARASSRARRDEPLYNAGLCLVQAGETRAAIASFRAVVRMKSPLARDAKKQLERLQR